MEPNPEIRDFLTTAIDEWESFNHWQRNPMHRFGRDAGVAPFGDEFR